MKFREIKPLAQGHTVSTKIGLSDCKDDVGIIRTNAFEYLTTRTLTNQTDSIQGTSGAPHWSGVGERG